MIWFRNLSLKPLAVVIILMFFVLFSFPANGLASEKISTDGSVTASIDTLNFSRASDTLAVSKELRKLGLTDTDITRRLDNLSDSELHHFATNSSEIYPGGSVIGAIIQTAIILAGAYAYIKYTGKRVVIE